MSKRKAPIGAAERDSARVEARIQIANAKEHDRLFDHRDVLATAYDAIKRTRNGDGSVRVLMFELLKEIRRVEAEAVFYTEVYRGLDGWKQCAFRETLDAATTRILLERGATAYGVARASTPHSGEVAGGGKIKAASRARKTRLGQLQRWKREHEEALIEMRAGRLEPHNRWTGPLTVKRLESEVARLSTMIAALGA